MKIFITREGEEINIGDINNYTCEQEDDVFYLVLYLTDGEEVESIYNMDEFYEFIGDLRKLGVAESYIKKFL